MSTARRKIQKHNREILELMGYEYFDSRISYTSSRFYHLVENNVTKTSQLPSKRKKKYKDTVLDV